MRIAHYELKAAAFLATAQFIIRCLFIILLLLLNCPCISFIHSYYFIKPLVSAFAPGGVYMLLKPVSLFAPLFFVNALIR